MIRFRFLSAHSAVALTEHGVFHANSGRIYLHFSKWPGIKAADSFATDRFIGPSVAGSISVWFVGVSISNISDAIRPIWTRRTNGRVLSSGDWAHKHSHIGQRYLCGNTHSSQSPITDKTRIKYIILFLTLQCHQIEWNNDIWCRSHSYSFDVTHHAQVLDPRSDNCLNTAFFRSVDKP